MKEIEKIANWKMIIVLAVVFLFFMLYLFPTYQAEINDIAGYEIQLLDGRFSYTKTVVTKAFEAMGGEGRKMYQFIVGFIDMIYPVVYGCLFFLLLVKLTKRNLSSRLKLIYFIPLMAVLFDYIENIGILKMLNNYPSIPESQVNINSLATSMKWIFVLLSLLPVFVLSISKLFTKKE